MEEFKQEIDHFERAGLLVRHAQQALAVDSVEKAESATAWLGQAITTAEVLESQRLAAGKTHRDALASINREFAAALEPLEVQIKRLRSLLSSWSMRVLMEDRKRQERERQEREQRAQDQAAASEEKSAGLRLEAEQAEERGDAAKGRELHRLAREAEIQANIILQHAAEVPVIAPASELTPIRSAAGTATAQIGWDYEVVDLKKVPARFITRTLNTRELKAALRVKTNEPPVIPGLRIFPKANLQIRR